MHIYNGVTMSKEDEVNVAWLTESGSTIILHFREGGNLRGTEACFAISTASKGSAWLIIDQLIHQLQEIVKKG